MAAGSGHDNKLGGASSRSDSPAAPRRHLAAAGSPRPATPAHPIGGIAVRLGLILLLLIYAAWALRFFFLTDDAYISFRYARHLASGIGLRFNAAEQPPVEGYSEFLWVLILAGGESFRIRAPVLAPVLSLLSGALLVVSLHAWLLRRLRLPLPVVWLALLFFIMLPTTAVWSTGGMATMPFALLVFLTFERLLGDPGRPRAVQAGLLGLAAALIRAEGLAWIVLLGLLLALRNLLDGDRRRWKPLGVFAAIVLVGFAAYFAWRLHYYGRPLPNTAYVKVGLTPRTLERGLRYAVNYLVTLPALPLVLLGALSLAARPRCGPACCAAAVTAATFAYAVVVGGDFMTMGRFFLVCLPFITVLFALLLARWWRAGRAPRLAAAYLALACVTLSVLPATAEFHEQIFPAPLRTALRFRWKYFRKQEDPPKTELAVWQLSRENAERWVKVGRAIHELCKPDESLVRGGIGAVGYYCDLTLHDAAGLTDPQVAARPVDVELKSAGHDKTVPIAWFEKHRPTYAFAELARTRSGRDIREVAASLFRIYMNPPEEAAIRDLYEPRYIRLPDSLGIRDYDYLVLGRRKVRYE